MRSFLFIITILISTSWSLTYQENVINVQGDAQRVVLPNEAVFKFSIETIHNNKDSVVVLMKPLIAKVDSIFAKYNLTKKEIKLTSLDLDATDVVDQFDSTLNRRYDAEREYKVTLQDEKIQILSQLLEELFTQTHAKFKDVAFHRTDRDSITKELLSEASEDARTNAEILAKQNNVRIVQASIISNKTPYKFSYENRVRINMTHFSPHGKPGGASNAGLPGRASMFTIEIPKIVIQNEVWITYKIKPIM